MRSQVAPAAAPFYQGSIDLFPMPKSFDSVAPHIMERVEIPATNATHVRNGASGAATVVELDNRGFLLSDVKLKFTRALASGNLAYAHQWEPYDIIDQMLLKVGTQIKYRITGRQMIEFIRTQLNDKQRQALAHLAMGHATTKERQTALLAAQTFTIPLFFPFSRSLAEAFPIGLMSEKLRLEIYWKPLALSYHQPNYATTPITGCAISDVSAVCDYIHVQADKQAEYTDLCSSAMGEGYVIKYLDWQVQATVATTETAVTATGTLTRNLKLDNLNANAVYLRLRLRWQDYEGISSPRYLNMDSTIPLSAVYLQDSSKDITYRHNLSLASLGTVSNSVLQTIDQVAAFPNATHGRNLSYVPLCIPSLIPSAQMAATGGYLLQVFNTLYVYYSFDQRYTSYSMNLPSYETEQDAAGALPTGITNTNFNFSVEAACHQLLTFKNGIVRRVFEI